MNDLASLHEAVERGHDLFDWSTPIVEVRHVDVDAIGSEPPQTALHIG